MNWWFWSYAFVGVLGLGIAIGKHGEPRGNYNGWISLVALVLDISFFVMALRHGGFP